MSSLYPSILFHFTDKKEKLLGILNGYFKVSYALERIEGANGKVREFAAPMVSFCDLRLSELPGHMKNYGKYGIGLTKNWATRNGLNTVAYWTRDGRLIANMFDSLEKQFSNLWGNDSVPDPAANKSYNDLVDVYRFIKNYEGRLVRREHKDVPNFRFANEREWRHVPPDDGAYRHLPFVSKKAFQEKGKAYWNKTIEELRLPFELNDIRYIIVSNEKERHEVSALVSAGIGKSSKKSNQATSALSSRILTAGQIRNDI
ncbi:MAG: hypothetical protein JSR72_23200 [Proteobacteria bacterium]|nr:hypothetical protein [Pseudomonadota bacterium]